MPTNILRVKTAFQSRFGRSPSDLEVRTLIRGGVENAISTIDLWHSLESTAKRRAELVVPLVRSFCVASGRQWSGLSARVSLAKAAPNGKHRWWVGIAVEIAGVAQFAQPIYVSTHEFGAVTGSAIDAVLHGWTLRKVVEEIAQREGARLTTEENAILDLCAIDPLYEAM